MVSNNFNMQNYPNRNYVSMGTIQYPVNQYQAYPQMNAGQGNLDPYQNRVNASKDSNPLAVLGLTLPIFYGINTLMDKFSEHCSNPDYRKTIFGKIESWGERIEGSTTNRTAFGKFMDKISGFFGKTSDKIKNNSAIAKNLMEVTAEPEWGFARMPWSGIKGMSETHLKDVFDKFLKPTIKLNDIGEITSFNPRKLEEYGELPKGYKNFTGEQVLDYEFKKLNEILGKNEIAPNTIKEKWEAVNKLKHEALGIKLGKSVNVAKECEQLAEDLMKNPTKYSGKPIAKLSASVFRRDGGILGFFSHVFGWKGSIQEGINKSRALSGQSKSKLANALNKGLAWFLEGTTNRFAGGKLFVMIQAAIFGDMIYHIIKAPKDEKIKTAAERGVNDFSYFLGTTVALQALFKIAGLQYLGNDKTSVEAYKKALKDFNIKAKGKEFATKEAYDEALKNLKAMLKKPDKWYQKILANMGKFLDIGNGPKAYRAQGEGFWIGLGNVFRRFFSKNTFKNMVGVPLRLIPVMFLLTPLFAKTTTKATHLVFGKPTNSVLDEEEPEGNLEEINDPMRMQYAQPQQRVVYTQPQQNVQQRVVYTQPQQNVQQKVVYTQPQQNVQQRVVYTQPQQNVQQRVVYTQPQQNVQQRVVYAQPQQIHTNPQIQTMSDFQNSKSNIDSKRNGTSNGKFGYVKPVKTDLSNYNKTMMEADEIEKYVQGIIAG